LGIRQAIWRVGSAPTQLPDARLPTERDLEEMIVARSAILSDEWMLIGRQEPTGAGGRIDLLAIAPDGVLVLIELKKGLTPRDVVAQAIDYAAWVEALDAAEINSMYQRFQPGHSLASDFQTTFHHPLDEDSLNGGHQIVIVSERLDEASERIVRYLSERGIAINVLNFQVFADDQGLLLSRAWLLDPVKAQPGVVTTERGPSEPWNGEFYASFGDGPTRSWTDATEYGFISGGGGNWYSNTLQLLHPGDRVWVLVPGSGYVGVAMVTGESTPGRDFVLLTSGGPRPALDVLTRGTYLRESADDPEKCEYFVPVRWLDTRPLAKAIREVGLFGNQNTVCKPVTPKWRHTVERLQQLLPGYASDAAIQQPAPAPVGAEPSSPSSP
jgi:hypothetical protein